ncbi:MAG: sugar phosphate nucleotidyltransferase [Caldilineaceae bacterium]
MWAHGFSRSRQSRPKQFSDITGDGRTMIQATVERIAPLTSNDQIYVVTGSQYAELTAQQLPQIPKENIIIEPSGRNTGPAIGLACMHLHQRDPHAIVAFIHSDHVIARGLFPRRPAAAPRPPPKVIW